MAHCDIKDTELGQTGGLVARVPFRSWPWRMCGSCVPPSHFILPSPKHGSSSVSQPLAPGAYTSSIFPALLTMPLSLSHLLEAGYSSKCGLQRTCTCIT
jgi:hypothetical protein